MHVRGGFMGSSSVCCSDGYGGCKVSCMVVQCSCVACLIHDV